VSVDRPPVKRLPSVQPPPNYPRQAVTWPRIGRRRSLGFPKRGAVAWILSVLAFFGGGALAAAYTGTRPHPATPTTAAVPAAPTQRPPPALKPLAWSVPTSIDIPAIGVHAPVSPLGTAANGTVQVPPLDEPNLAGWYRGSVTPGQTGNSVILGHVDANRAGAAIFYHLGTLKAGDLVTITRADRSTAVFRIYGVASYARSAFPTALVYGPNRRPELRLVTCGGVFDAKTHQYQTNIIAVADMVSTKPATGD
jgi:sortase (surface protein transpeptidase)